MGIATFGPCDLNRASPTYGFITTTPKAGWENVNLLGILRQAFHVPTGFDTDVNAAALGEFMWGAGQGLEVVLYLTVGTGIGGGGVVHGRMMHGLMHRKWGTFVCRECRMLIGSPASARTTETACKVWLPGRPWRHDGGGHRMNFLRATRPGRPRLATLPWQ